MNFEEKLQSWGGTLRGRRFLLALQAAIVGFAIISCAAELLSK